MSAPETISPQGPGAPDLTNPAIDTDVKDIEPPSATSKPFDTVKQPKLIT
jgi:hypothetical protein